MILRRCSFFGTRYAWLLVTLAALALGLSSVSVEPSPPEGTSALPDSGAELGKRIYREGILPSGEPLRATGAGEAMLAGVAAACVSCHRPSGFGSSEGQTVNRPVTGSALYRAREILRSDRVVSGREGSGTPRPAYTDESLARAIREGIDPAGRVLDVLMPRYALGQQDFASLIAYLKSLSEGPSPGLTDTTIHFATTISEGVDPGRRKAMLDILDVFFREKGADARGEARRAQTPLSLESRKHRAYRKWDLHRWELRGSRDTWAGQLEAYYRQQPVFALLSGVGTGSWQPVHAFCERFKVPCLFPNTDLPTIAETGWYTVYLSKGMTLEAEALARHLQDERPGGLGGPIVQVFRDDDEGVVPAATLRRALHEYGIGGVRDRRLAPGEGAMVSFWERLLEQERPAMLVLWLREQDFRGLDRLAGLPVHPSRIYLSSSLTGGRTQAVPLTLADKAYLVHPFELPETWERRLYRMKAWMQAKGIQLTDERLQASTYFTLSLAGEALMHIGGNFSREYFLERVEHAAENALASSVYPRMSLGPEQRFASKGCYILRFSQAAKGGWSAATDWIVP